MNSNCNCSMSVLKKPCPRKRFPCSRCGAKIVNAGLQWEISIPVYKQWFYLNALTMSANSIASSSPVIFYASRVVPFVDSEVSGPSPCKFDGPDVSQGYVVIGSGTTPASGDAWVQDFEWSRFSADFDGWNQFGRRHIGLVDWVDATINESSGEVVTPGSWRIFIRINQQAIGYSETAGPGGITYNNLNVAPGHFVDAGIGGPFSDGNSGDTDVNDYGTMAAYYYPPNGYGCLSRTSTIWTRPIPTLPVIQNTTYTVGTLPAGYSWPDDARTDMPSDGPFYPTGFTADSYWMPPYIDVRHTPK